MHLVNMTLPIFLVIFLGFVPYIMALELGEDLDLTASIVMMSTLFSVISLLVWIWIVWF